jgi:hypothetical protein
MLIAIGVTLSQMFQQKGDGMALPQSQKTKMECVELHQYDQN